MEGEGIDRSCIESGRGVKILRGGDGIDEGLAEKTGRAGKDGEREVVFAGGDSW